MVGTGKLSRVLWCNWVSWHLVSCTPHNQHFHFWFRPFAGKIALSSKTTGKRSHLVHFCYCYSVIKYLMRDMMDYHCLRVLRSRVRRIGKHSPGCSVFRTGCMAVPMLIRAVFRSRAASWRSFLLTINLSHARQVTYEVWGFHVTDGDVCSDCNRCFCRDGSENNSMDYCMFSLNSKGKIVEKIAICMRPLHSFIPPEFHPTGVLWTGLALGEPPCWTQQTPPGCLLCQVSMLHTSPCSHRG